MEHTMDDLAAIEKGEGYADRLSTRVAITLNPDAPIQYKGLNFTPDGFGKYFSYTFLNNGDLQPFIEIIRGAFLLQIVRQKTDLDQAQLLGKFDSCRAFIGQAKIGSGIERCLYYLDPDCPCVSETLSDFCVRSPEDMMRALNKVAKGKDRPTRIIDRHIAAFLSVKDRKNIDPYVVDLGSAEEQKRILAELKVLATIQKRSQLEDFPELAGWVADRLGPVYEKLHDREKRKLLSKKVAKLAKGGDLTKIAFLFDDEHLYDNDFYMFGQARDKFEDLLKEEHYLGQKLETKKGFGEKTGHQIASFISLILSIVIISIVAFVKLHS